jgi:flavin-dependent dehydrogenase
MQAQSAHLAMRLNQATPCWERPLSMSAIPYGYVRDETQDGLWRLGDQSAVIPSFAGDGMSIALHSARLAATMFEQGSRPSNYQTRLAHDVSRQVGLATLLSQSLVHPQLSRLLSSAARLWPGVLAHVATSTRIRAENLVR